MKSLPPSTPSFAAHAAHVSTGSRQNRGDTSADARMADKFGALLDVKTPTSARGEHTAIHMVGPRPFRMVRRKSCRSMLRLWMRPPYRYRRILDKSPSRRRSHKSSQSSQRSCQSLFHPILRVANACPQMYAIRARVSSRIAYRRQQRRRLPPPAAAAVQSEGRNLSKRQMRLHLWRFLHRKP